MKPVKSRKTLPRGHRVKMDGESDFPIVRWMQEFYNAGEIVEECGSSRIDNGLHVVWHEATRTGFVFGDIINTGPDYKALMVKKEGELRNRGFDIGIKVSNAQSGVEGLIYSGRAA